MLRPEQDRGLNLAAWTIRVPGLGRRWGNLKTPWHEPLEILVSESSRFVGADPTCGIARSNGYLHGPLIGMGDLVCCAACIVHRAALRASCIGLRCVHRAACFVAIRTAERAREQGVRQLEIRRVATGYGIFVRGACGMLSQLLSR
jgi:hypothetical protein